VADDLAEAAEGTPRATCDAAEVSAWPGCGRRGELHPRATRRLADAGATRSGAHKPTCAGCAQHTRPHPPLFDLDLPGAQDMNACYAKRRAGAVLACGCVTAHRSIASTVTARRFA
jgi:hypothetical protein